MLSIAYLYVSIDYDDEINYKIKSLLFDMEFQTYDNELISDIKVDIDKKVITLELSYEGYLYLKERMHESSKINLEKVIFYLSGSYKFKKR